MKINEEPLEMKAMEVEAVELSLKSVVGFSSLGTIKLRGKIEDKEVIVLINCGTTHNFMLKESWINSVCL